MKDPFIVGQRVRITRGRHKGKIGVITNIDTVPRHYSSRTLVDVEIPLESGKYFYRSKKLEDERKMYTKVETSSLEHLKKETPEEDIKVNRLLMVGR